MSTHPSLGTLLSMVLVVCWGSTAAGQYVQVSPDLELYYEEAGTGTPLIFITGWTGTNEFFLQHQFPHFARKYRVLAYDPRSQGRSSKMLENNTYIQHGRDLRAFMEALELKDVVLIGWSFGCLDAYAYFRAFGTTDVRAFICIDQPPRPIPAQQGDWAEFAEASEAGGFINAVVYDRRGLLSAFVPTMMKREMTHDEIAWALDQMLLTPTFAAALLAADGSFADYTEEAKMIDGKIPVLNVLSVDRAEVAKGWLAKNAPHSEIFVSGNHMMFREFPDAFNAAVDAFLARVK